MKNALYFSDFIKPFMQRVRFASIIIARFLKILFRGRKNIKLLEFSYNRGYQFDSSYLIVRYSFRNALWYNFKNIKKTTEKEIIILNLENIPVVPVELVVHGFFRKKLIRISVIPDRKIESNHFKVIINGIDDFEMKSQPIVLQNIKLVPGYSKIEVVNAKPYIIPAKTQLKQSLYDQNDFI